MKNDLKKKLIILLEKGRVTTEYAGEAARLKRMTEKITGRKAITFYGGSGFENDAVYHVWVF